VYFLAKAEHLMKIEIEDEVKKIIEGAFEVEEIDDVPELNDERLVFGSKGLSFEATVVYVVLKESTQILNKHNEAMLAKIRIAYFYLIAEVVNPLGGVVRQAHDDGVYVFFQGTTQDSLNSAVKAAMKIKYMLTNDYSRIKKVFESYDAANFAIGIDDGSVLCVKLGSQQSPLGGLVWSGQPLKIAVEIADKLKAPDHIGISEIVHYNLVDAVKYNKGRDKLGNERQVEIWHSASFDYNNEVQKYYRTSFFWTVT
jgi:class 3 adenylate cyclase